MLPPRNSQESRPSAPLFRRVQFAPSALPMKSDGKVESPLMKFAIGGGATLILELCGGHYLEMIKIRKQTSPQFSYAQLTKQMTAHKGLAGLLDGFVPWGVIQALLKGASFGWGHAASMKMLHGVESLSEGQRQIISGAAGGLVQGVCMSPVLLLKTRVMTNPAFRTSGGLLSTAAESGKVGMAVIRTEGVSALCKGMGVFSFKRMADWTTRYFFVVEVESLLKGESNRKLSVSEQLFSSFAGGALSAGVTIPLDVLVATFQQAGKAGQKVSVVDTFRELSNQGFGKIWEFSTRGLAARVMHVGVTTVLMKTVTSLIYDALQR